MGLFSKLFTIKNEIICLVFFAYIYDLIRAGYFESKRRHLRVLQESNSVSAYFKDNCAPLPAAAAAAANSADMVWPGRGKAPLSNLWASRPERRRQTASKLLQVINRTVGKSVARIAHLLPLTKQPESGSGSKLIRRGNELNKSESTTSRSPVALLRKLKRSPSVEVEDELEGEAANEVEDDDEYGEEDDCPLEEMPAFIRAYQYISHTLVLISFLKYLYLNLVKCEMFGLRRALSCYIPGRVLVLPEFDPSFPLIVLFYHLIYRIYLCLYRKSFELDCFLFVLYDEQHMQWVESQYDDIVRRQQGCSNGPQAAGDPVELRKFYAHNRMFFIRSRLADQKFIYKPRSNRTMKHWIKLKEFYHRFTLACAWNFVIWSFPLLVLTVAAVISENNFNILYGHCNKLSDEHNPTKWTWSHWRRYIWLLGDMLDNGWLLFDTANALVWPFSSMVFCAQDMTYSVDNLIVSTNSLINRLKTWLYQNHLNVARQNIRTAVGSKQQAGLATADLADDEQLFDSIRDEILVAQSEINDVLQQMNLVDQFVSREACFCIFCWIVTNLYYQLVSLTAKRLFILSGAVQFMQATAFVAISFSFAYMSITHSKTRRLYRQICNIAALDPNHSTKASWLWVLEYYQRGKSRYSFHLGPFVELSLANYLKSVSWLITGGLVTISLFKHKYQMREIADSEG